MTGFVSFILAAGTSFLGAFFIAATAFKKFFKASNTSYLQLAGFLVVFIACFAAIACFIGWALPPERVAFGR